MKEMTPEGKAKPWPFNGYAPGNYMNDCAVCKKTIYNVDKLCFICLECAVTASQQSPTHEAVAVAFAEWISKKRYIPSTRMRFEGKYVDIRGNYFTTPELFTLFTESPEYKELFK